MPRGSGRWSRAGTPTGRRFVMCAPTHPTIHEAIRSADEDMKKSINLRAFDSDMQDVLRRASKMGAELIPLKHGAARIHLPGDTGKDLYVPKNAGPGTVTDLNDALSRYERGERAGAVIPEEEDPITHHRRENPVVETTAAQKADEFIAYFWELKGERDRLIEERDELALERDDLQARLDQAVEDKAKELAEWNEIKSMPGSLAILEGLKQMAAQR